MFETRSHSWREVGLARQLSVQAAKRARVEVLLLLPVFVGIVLLYNNRQQWLGVDVPVRAAAAVLLVIVGWAIARDIGRAAGPALFRRLDPGTAGTVGFLIRLVTIGGALILALQIAGLDPRTLALGGAFTAVVLGLAAQQTLGNLIAGTVLLSARPFRVGDRVRLQGGPLAGQVEGVVSTLGLLYTTFATGEDAIMVPNSVVLNVAITPLREPDAVSLRARLRPGTTPRDLQATIQEAVSVPIRDEPRITLEELDGDEVIVQISATPQLASDGPQLATEVLKAVTRQAQTRNGDGDPPDADSPDADSPEPE
jgi:small conductance mechanosensitive channel